MATTFLYSSQVYLLITMNTNSRFFKDKCEFSGPFPLTYRETCPQEMLNVVAYIMQGIPPEKKKPFGRISEQEISKEDKEFILK
jgi:hypothetical protein